MPSSTEMGGPRVEKDEIGGDLWLTWEEVAMGGSAWEWKQRRLTILEALLWRIARKVPKP